MTLYPNAAQTREARKLVRATRGKPMSEWIEAWKNVYAHTADAFQRPIEKVRLVSPMMQHYTWAVGEHRVRTFSGWFLGGALLDSVGKQGIHAYVGGRPTHNTALRLLIHPKARVWASELRGWVSSSGVSQLHIVATRVVVTQEAYDAVAMHAQKRLDLEREINAQREAARLLHQGAPTPRKLHEACNKAAQQHTDQLCVLLPDDKDAAT